MVPIIDKNLLKYNGSNCIFSNGPMTRKNCT